MNADAICKYAAAAALMASVLVLVILGNVDASLYVALVTSALAGLGVHAASNTGNVTNIAAPPIAEPAPSPSTQEKP